MNSLGILLADGHCSIRGYPCKSVGALEGICVPLDEHGQSQDCYNVYGFLDTINPNSCADAYGENFTNVGLACASIFDTSLGVVFGSLVTTAQVTASLGMPPHRPAMPEL